MKATQMIALFLTALVASTGAEMDFGRKLLQTVRQGSPSTLTVSASNPIVNAITITLSIPYPQNAYFCNVTGDSRIPQQGPFPLTVRVPVGVTSTVVFANITGPIPGSTCQMGSSVVQQPGQAVSSVVQQSSPSVPTSVQQMINNPSSVVQQTSGGASVVQQQYATSVNQQVSGASLLSCSNGAPATSVVQQPSPPKSPPTTVVQQPSTPTTLVQQSSTPTTVVQQPSPPTTVVQQPSTPKSPPTTVVQQPSPPTTVVQQPSPPKSPPTTVVQQPTTPTTVVQQPSTPATVVQQPQSTTPATVVQQSPSVVQQSGRHLLQAGTIEYISNNGTTGAQLTVLDTTEGVPNISFKPTAAGQTAQFNGGLQVAKTTTNDGFGTPYIPYQVDARLSPQCAVQVNFVSF